MDDRAEPAFFTQRGRAADAVLTPDRLEPRAMALAVAVAATWRLVALCWTSSLV